MNCKLGIIEGYKGEWVRGVEISKNDFEEVIFDLGFGKIRKF